jgi:nucleoside-diphosphate-sugar epimerase
MNILVTGSSGFIGSQVAKKILAQGTFHLSCLSSKDLNPISGDQKTRYTIFPDADHQSILKGQDVVVHAANFSNFKKHAFGFGKRYYQRLNVEGTINLAKQASEAKVRRFVFLSSTKVFGESSLANFRLNSCSDTSPKTAYGVSKLETERQLFRLSEQTGMEVVIIRPPIVYGPNMRGSLKLLIRLFNLGLPLPFKGLTARRSFISVDNLSGLIFRCLDHPAAKNQIFLASDDQDISVEEFLSRLALTSKKPLRLFSIPEVVLLTIEKLFGNSSFFKSAFAPFEVDIKKTKTLLDWQPSKTFDECLQDYHKHWA